MAAYRRDKLLRLLAAGKLVVTDSYHFDDMYGASRLDKEMPAAVSPANWQDRKEGVCYILDCSFTGHGRAYLNPNGTVTLYVHSNLNYTFRILE